MVPFWAVIVAGLAGALGGWLSRIGTVRELSDGVTTFTRELATEKSAHHRTAETLAKHTDEKNWAQEFAKGLNQKLADTRKELAETKTLLEETKATADANSCDAFDEMMLRTEMEARYDALVLFLKQVNINVEVKGKK